MKALPKTKAGAVMRAHKLLGKDAVEGIHFSVANTGAGWTHEGVEPEALAATKTKKVGKAPAQPKPKKAAVAQPVTVVKPPRPVRKPKVEGEKKVSKASIIRALLKRPEGADADEMAKAVTWTPQSAEWFVKGTLKKQGIQVSRTKEGERTVYRIVEAAEAAEAAEPI